MALTPTKKIPLGFIAPDFNLINPFLNHEQSLKNLKGDKATLIVFMCNHCPYVIHVLPELVKLANEYEEKGISVIGINSNDIQSHPDDSPENMIKLIHKYNIPFPYLFDETQEIAKKYGAVCTPDFFGYNCNLELQYRGRIRELKDLKPVSTGESDLFNAMKMIAETGRGPQKQIPSMGCNIKWFK